MQAMNPAVIPQWTIADKLRKARETAGLEQGDLADLIDASRSTISNYESNRYTKRRRRQTLRMWAWACGVEPTWIDPSLEGPNPGGGGSIRPVSQSACTNRPLRSVAPLAIDLREAA